MDTSFMIRLEYLHAYCMHTQTCYKCIEMHSIPMRGSWRRYALSFISIFFSFFFLSFIFVEFQLAVRLTAINKSDASDKVEEALGCLGRSQAGLSG